MTLTSLCTSLVLSSLHNTRTCKRINQHIFVSRTHQKKIFWLCTCDSGVQWNPKNITEGQETGKFVHYNNVSLYRRFFPYTVFYYYWGKEKIFVCYQGFHYIEVCYIEVLLYKKQILKEIVKTIVSYTAKVPQSSEGVVLPLFTPFPTIIVICNPLSDNSFKNMSVHVVWKNFHLTCISDFCVANERQAKKNKNRLINLKHSLRLCNSPYFFPGWLCHFKGLFKPVWRKIPW